MAEQKRIDDVTGTATSGHEWDGIEELATPMPRWWLWSLYASIVWGIVYVILYPAWPMIHGATEGVLGWTSHGQQIGSAHVCTTVTNAPLVCRLLLDKKKYQRHE